MPRVNEDGAGSEEAPSVTWHPTCCLAVMSACIITQEFLEFSCMVFARCVRAIGWVYALLASTAHAVVQASKCAHAPGWLAA